MSARVFSLPRIWGVLSRTRPCTPLPRQRTRNRTPRGIWGTFGGSFWYFIYQGLGITAPFGLCYVIGVVVAGIAGDGISAATLIAAVASLLAGLCYSELITSSRQCSGNASTAIYQLVGELPAYFAAYLSVLISCASFAAMSKALSSTMEELSHASLRAFLANIFGNLPFSGLPPDVFGFGAALVTSVLLACGLKQAGALRTCMNLFSLTGIIFFLCIGGSHMRSNAPRKEENNQQPRQILAGAGVCCCLFFQYLELGRRSKGQIQANLKLPVAISCTTVLVLMSSLSLGVLLTIMMDNRWPITGAPLLRALQLRDVDWARLVMGSIQVVIISLGLSESGESVCRHLVGMASEGFIPKFLSMECPLAFSHSRAHLLGGVAASILALLLTHVHLLEFMAVNILLLNVLIILATLYRPFRCTYDSLCPITLTPRKIRTVSSTSRLKVNDSSANINSTRTLHFLKNGIRVLALTDPAKRVIKRDDELGIPLLSPLHGADDSHLFTPDDESGAAREESSPSTSKYQTRFEESEEPSVEAECQILSHEGITSTDDLHREMEISPMDVSDVNSNDDSELIELTDSPASNDENEESLDDIVHEDSDIPQEEDIDTIVSEYKEQLRVSSAGSKLRAFPTKATARRALLCILSLAVLSASLSIFSVNVTGNTGSRTELSSALRTVFVLAVLLMIFALLIVLTQLPTVKATTSSEQGFRIICSTWVSFIALFLNTLLATELLSKTIWIVLPVHLSGIIWYAAYTSRHSVVATSQLYGGLKQHEDTGKENEMVCLSPVLPAITAFTSRPQRDELNRTI